MSLTIAEDTRRGGPVQSRTRLHISKKHHLVDYSVLEEIVVNQQNGHQSRLSPRGNQCFSTAAMSSSAQPQP